MNFFSRMFSHPWQFIVPIIGAVIAIAGVVASLLQWSALQVDRASSHKQEAIVSAALSRSMQRIAKDQEAATVWDDAIAHLDPPNLDWLDANLGIWMHTYYGHDQTFILNSADQPLYAMVEGNRMSPTTYAAARDAAGPLVKELRSKLVSGVKPESDDILSPGATDIAVVGGHPAIISAKPIVSDTGKISQVPGSEAIHISVRYLDGDFIRRLSTAYLLDLARFSWNDDRTPDEISIPYRTRSGMPVGHLIWSPYLPGSKVSQSMRPALIGALAAVVLIIGLLAIALRKGATALRQSEARARHLAEHDNLTDLPNRMLFQVQLRRLLRARNISATNLALLSLDLDHFKEVNDSFGHPAGDELLRQVAGRLSANVRGTDLVARLGGDEFSVILPDVEWQRLAEICSRLLTAIHQPFDIFGNQVFIGLSIGIAVAPQDASTEEELISRSDVALYVAKRQGRGKSVRYSRALERKGESWRPSAATGFVREASGFYPT